MMHLLRYRAGERAEVTEDHVTSVVLHCVGVWFKEALTFEERPHHYFANVLQQICDLHRFMLCHNVS